MAQIECPTCAKSTQFAPTNPWRPFCSERCRSIDLGAWASERFRVAASSEPTDGDSDGPPQPEPSPAGG